MRSQKCEGERSDGCSLSAKPRRKSSLVYFKMNGAGNNSVTHLVIDEEEGPAPRQLSHSSLQRGSQEPSLSHIARRSAVNNRRSTRPIAWSPAIPCVCRPSAWRPGPGRSRGGGQQRVDLPIVFEDEALLVIDKPEGWRSRGQRRRLRCHRGPCGGSGQAKFLELAHRLDRETSGILLVGSGWPSPRSTTCSASTAPIADKRYLVLVRALDERHPHVRQPLHNTSPRRRRTPGQHRPQGKAAHTVFRSWRAGRAPACWKRS